MDWIGSSTRTGSCSVGHGAPVEQLSRTCSDSWPSDCMGNFISTGVTSGRGQNSQTVNEPRRPPHKAAKWRQTFQTQNLFVDDAIHIKGFLTQSNRHVKTRCHLVRSIVEPDDGTATVNHGLGRHHLQAADEERNYFNCPGRKASNMLFRRPWLFDAERPIK